MDPELLEDHIPVRFLLTPQGPVIRWCYVGDQPFTAPFLDHDIEAQLNRPANVFFQPRTNLEGLARFVEQANAPEPSGFVFHMSRCGSTLITQMLRGLPANIVLSEPSVVDSVLRIRRMYPGVTEEQHAEWLRLVVSAVGYPRQPQERRLFVKFDCWHVMLLPVLRRAFPDTPFVFVYRDPVEVMVSQVSRPGSQMMPHFVNAENYGINLSDAIRFTQEQYCARVLAAICRGALEYHRRDPMMLIEYRQFPEVVWNGLADHFGLELTADDIDRMREYALADAKHPELKFTSDSEQKRQAATSELLRETEEWLAPLYAELETERAATIDPSR